jgi:HTH-type transcriptional regulator, transcriptional repressor of NAD biosynthesis genes
MKRGLVIGKFMPVHEGHVALIHFALAHCDELIVSMSYTEADPISGALRISWLRELFRNDPRIRIESVVDDFGDPALAWTDRTRVWAKFLRGRYGKIDVIVSSEVYGPFLATQLAATSVLFDPERLKYPVSASDIRQHPFRNWSFIPAIVRPFFVKRLCFYGPESTGKSTLAETLARVYQTNVVPEVAREMVTSNQFTLEEIIQIGHAQTNRILDKTKTANKILFCDTDLITTQIYCFHYLKQIPPVLFELERAVTYHQYFLFDIDVPWVADNLRDLGSRRLEMYQIFRQELTKRKLHFIEVRGSYQEREAMLRAYCDNLLSS